MKRYRDDRPSDICFARGTFNSHPYVMGTMNEFLRRLEEPGMLASYERLDERWNTRAESLNARLAAQDLPVRVVNFCSVWTTVYTLPSRFNWMFQFYLRAQGLSLSWVGSGRIVFSHNYTDEDFEAVAQRFLAAAREMQADGWWWQGAELSNKSIRRRVLREVLAAALGRRDGRPGAAEPTPAEPLAACAKPER
jgi:glutamate-1-semialdehyde 2,1-aminomutase